MDGSAKGVWEMRKSYLETQAQKAASLLAGPHEAGTAPASVLTTSAKTEKISHPAAAGPDQVKTSLQQSNHTLDSGYLDPSHQNSERNSTKTDPEMRAEPTESCNISNLETKSAPDLAECQSQSRPLLNGISSTNVNGVSRLSRENSRTSVWSLGPREGSVLSFHKVNYTVHVPQKARCSCGKKQDLAILKDLSGSCHPGMNAILGATGSGKTSLLDILAGRKDPTGLSGEVLVDGSPQPNNFKCMAGYVIQDDIVVGMLTVRENIHFSAALRLPSTVTPAQRTHRVNEVITELGLTKCADTKIGTAFKRGVSGGERKRTNIAMELITAPSVLFLDEPTTGLDATTAYSVMHLLKRLSRKGTTIIFSIHQPRYSIYKLFDKMFLLHHGDLMYQGQASQALDYFNSIGYVCEEHNNPSDFFLDVLNNVVLPSSSLETDSTQETAANKNGGALEQVEFTVEIEEDEDHGTKRHNHLCQLFKESKWYQSEVTQLSPIESSLEEKTHVRAQTVQYRTSFCRQMCIVGSRTFQNMVRNIHTLTTQVFSAIILSILVGSIYFQVDNSFTSGLQNRVGAFFFIVMNFVFSNMTAMDIFLKDRAVFIHENISGYYRVSVYFLSKLLCDVIPQRFLPVVVFATISYWMIGFSATGSQFLFFCLNVFLTSMAGTSVALTFSATVQTGSIGSLFTALVWVIMMVFSGLLVNLESVPVWLRWIKYVSIFRYSMNAFSVNELTNMTFCDESDNSTISSQHCDFGNEYMQRQGIPYQNTWDPWINEVMLCVIATFFLILTYIQLRRIKKLN